MRTAFLAAAVLAVAGVVFYFSTTVNAAKASGSKPVAPHALASTRLSLPLFFEPNQGQTAPQVKFLARGAGYGLFLTADQAVLRLQPSAVSPQPSATSSEPKTGSVIRMRLDGANSSARVSGASPLPGKSNYFIGNDPSKWRHDIPQFARVEYRAVYPGIDLVYYGNQGQLEYDFRVAPGAEPNQIALCFEGASTRIVSGDSGDSGDLILSTANGDVRFLAPRVYQQDGNIQKTVAGSFRQIAGNKIGFTVGAYDHNRELVIDPILSYSTYLGGSGTESLVQIAVDSNTSIYVAGTTESTDFPVTDGSSLKGGAKNIFIAKLVPTAPAQLAFATYLGGSGTDLAAGIKVDSNFSIYVAGTTTSTDFPTTSNAFNPGPVSGRHGFLSKLSLTAGTYGPSYSTYLAGNGIDQVTGLAIDNSDQNAFVTGDTTSTNDQSNGFPSNPNGYQLLSNSPGHQQFFASKINTGGSGSQSMLYSTYFGGGNPVGATAQGGGMAVDASGNLYITGTTNMLPTTGGNGEVKFPLFNAQQSCLDEAGNPSTCTLSNPTATDAFVAKINPNQAQSSPLYSTYVGGSGDDVGAGIAVDSSGNAYITGKTDSTDFIPSSIIAGSFQQCLNNTVAAAPCPTSSAKDAFIAKIGNAVSGGIFPLNYATYIGGSGDDSGQAIQVDAVQAVHVTGSTASPDLQVTGNALQNGTYGGAGDAFVALISTTLSGQGAGDLLTYLGGSQLDEGMGIALDIFGATYVAGDTRSSDFPVTPATAYQPHLDGLPGGPADAFVSKIGSSSGLTITPSNTSPSPNPVPAGTQAAFTFDITNTGPDAASLVIFNATVPNTNELASTATAKVTSGSGSCTAAQVAGQVATIICNIPTLAVNAMAAVEVDVTPSITTHGPQVSVSGTAGANGATTGSNTLTQSVPVVDFGISASTSTPSINAGDTATIQVVFAPTNGQYSATITPSQTTSPSIVTATAPTFNPTTVTLSGSASGTTTLSIATVPRPVTTGTLFRRGSFYAAWLPIGGLSLVGLGIGAGRKRRRWLAALVLGMIAGTILLQSGCGSSSSNPAPSGGTQAGTYTITITGSAAAGASHNTQVQLTVH